MGRHRRVVVDERAALCPGHFRWRGGGRRGTERRRAQPAADMPRHRCSRHDGGERRVEGEERDERRDGDAPQPAAAQRPPPIRRAACATMAVTAGWMPWKTPATAGVSPCAMYSQARATRMNSDGSTKARPPGCRPTCGAAASRGRWRVAAPRVRAAACSSSAHAKSAFGDPAAPVHQFVVHERDLPGRPAETDEAELQPETQGLREGHGGRASALGGRSWHGALPLLLRRETRGGDHGRPAIALLGEPGGHIPRAFPTRARSRAWPAPPPQPARPRPGGPPRPSARPLPPARGRAGRARSSPRPGCPRSPARRRWARRAGSVTAVCRSPRARARGPWARAAGSRPR